MYLIMINFEIRTHGCSSDINPTYYPSLLSCIKMTLAVTTSDAKVRFNIVELVGMLLQIS